MQSSVQATQPRRLGKITGGCGASLAVRMARCSALFGRTTSTLALRAIDSDGVADEPGAPLPVGAIQGAGLAGPPGTLHVGRVLLLSRPHKYEFKYR